MQIDCPVQQTKQPDTAALEWRLAFMYFTSPFPKGKGRLCAGPSLWSQLLNYLTTLAWVNRYFSDRHTDTSNAGIPVRNFPVPVFPTCQFQEISAEGPKALTSGNFLRIISANQAKFSGDPIF